MTDLVTERLVLKPLHRGDLAALRTIFADKAHMWDLMDIPGRSNDPTELAFYYLARSLWSFETYGVGMWGLHLRESQNTLIVGYTGAIIDVGEEADISKDVEAGWAVAPGSAGKGYAAEGTMAAFDHLFDRHRTARISAVTSPDNWASRRLMERLGLVREADITAYQGLQVVYAIDRDTWLSRGSK